MAQSNQTNSGITQTKNATFRPLSAVAGNSGNINKIEQRIWGMGSRPPKFWLIFGSLVALAFIAIFAFTLVSGRKKQLTGNVPAPGEVAQKAHNVSPVALPAIVQTDQNSGQTNELKQYFKAVSGAYKDEFMANIPEITLDAYKKYKDAPAGDAKLEAARAFFIYLSNPGKYKDDISYKQFLKDVRANLENTLGRALFAGQ